MMIVYGLSLYILIGLIIIVWQGRELVMEITGTFYSAKGSPRLKVAIVITLTLGVFIWPSVLRREEKSHRLYIVRDVSERFSSVSRDRGEVLEGIVLSLLTSKFIRVYEEFGLKMYEEHMKYELEKFREEGLREDYIGRG